eukprot:gnl/TRDRNA2_/TRDRNA2_202032_c0_seq1.p1 gnl/TRDRNA2_/TRDRNA2_202032_c0~~gnl/TRDRNA2_/TRDRNA2_202032_c0_seq1.p1  ORF type:complete len:370 (-),score=51.12 gnl/TRDRNA2_/TRDRNA2_202032_c0_seq1:223-1332(-)
MVWSKPDSFESFDKEVRRLLVRAAAMSKTRSGGHGCHLVASQHVVPQASTDMVSLSVSTRESEEPTVSKRVPQKLLPEPWDLVPPTPRDEVAVVDCAVRTGSETSRIKSRTAVSAGVQLQKSEAVLEINRVVEKLRGELLTERARCDELERRLAASEAKQPAFPTSGSVSPWSTRRDLTGQVANSSISEASKGDDFQPQCSSACASGQSLANVSSYLHDGLVTSWRDEACRQEMTDLEEQNIILREQLKEEVQKSLELKRGQKALEQQVKELQDKLIAEVALRQQLSDEVLRCRAKNTPAADQLSQYLCTSASCRDDDIASPSSREMALQRSLDSLNAEVQHLRRDARTLRRNQNPGFLLPGDVLFETS